EHVAGLAAGEIAGRAMHRVHGAVGKGLGVEGGGAEGVVVVPQADRVLRDHLVGLLVGPAYPDFTSHRLLLAHGRTPPDQAYRVPRPDRHHRPACPRPPAGGAAAAIHRCPAPVAIGGAGVVRDPVAGPVAADPGLADQRAPARGTGVADAADRAAG